MNLRLAIAFLLLSTAFFVGCDNQSAEPPADTVMDYDSLVDNLSRSEVVVEPIGDMLQPPFPRPIFSGTAKLIELNSENFIVWEYDDEATAEIEAKFVSPDGFDLRKPPDSKGEGIFAHVDYIAPPHWYENGRLIVLYVGKDQEITDLLENLLGEQFAGQEITQSE